MPVWGPRTTIAPRRAAARARPGASAGPSARPWRRQTRERARSRRVPSARGESGVVRTSRLLHGSNLNATGERLLDGTAVGDLQEPRVLLGGQIAVQLDHAIEPSRADVGRLALQAILDVRGRVAQADDHALERPL